MTAQVIVYPPNTKDAKFIIGNYTIVVDCPFCGKKHHHATVEQYITYATAKCGKGYYVLRRK